MRTSVLSAVSAAVLAFSGQASAATAEEWKSQSIYQVMIDRFARTDLSTTAECETHLFCNGTWRGLIKKLDYIQDMGFTAIQISPTVENIKEHTPNGDPYHGYYPKNINAINKNFGTEQDLKDLSDELHKRGMLLMVDVVVNHMAQAFDTPVPPKIDYSQFEPFDDPKYFHPYCNVTKWEDPENYQKCWLYPYGVALVDLKTESQAVVDLMTKWIKEQVEKYNIDGLRIDAAKHVNDEFLPKFVEASGVFALGEVLTGVPIDMCRYQTLGLLPGMPNYLEYHQVEPAFNGGSFVPLSKMRDQAASTCNDTLVLGSFIENHDMPRFASKNNDLALAKNAMTYVIMNDGIPTVYQGQEQHFNGSHDPNNREALWTSGYDQTHPLYVLAAKLNKVRTNAIKLSKEYLAKRSETVLADVNHYCLKKGPDGTQTVFCINNKSSKGDNYEMTVKGFKSNEAVVEVTRCTSITADAMGGVKAWFGKGEPRVFTTAKALEGTGICPEAERVVDAEPDSAAGALGVHTGLLMTVMAAFTVLFFA